MSSGQISAVDSPFLSTDWLVSALNSWFSSFIKNKKGGAVIGGDIFITAGRRQLAGIDIGRTGRDCRGGRSAQQGGGEGPGGAGGPHYKGHVGEEECWGAG